MRPRRALAAVTLILTMPVLGQVAGSGDPMARASVPIGEAPRPPEFLQVDGGEDNWHPDNGFRLDWKNPTASLGPTIVAVDYRVLNAAKAVVVPDTRIVGPPTTISPLRVPDVPGIYTAEVWLENAFGKAGVPAAAKLRFDDVRPGISRPQPVPDWIGATSFPYVVRLNHPAEPLPLSGIRGYAVSVDQSPGAEPCGGSDRCSDEETDLRAGVAGDSLVLSSLPDGTSYVRTAAVSNAGLRSTVAGTVLHVDTTDPQTSLYGAPGGWIDRPVTVTASAVDSTSGMQAAGAAGPFTAIRIDDDAPTTAAGSSVSASLIGEGVHTVTYYARDAAGNVNDGGMVGTPANSPPSTATVRIDRTPPSLAFVDAQRPAEPELIEARLSDSRSGPSRSDGRISIRRNVAGEQFEPLPTEISGPYLRTRWDSDAYPAGEYEFRATGYDVAGNSATTGRRGDGARMVLSNPLKAPTSLQSGFGGTVLIWHRCDRRGDSRRCQRQVVRGFKQRPKLRRVPYGKGSLFSGRLALASGATLAQMPVQVTERFDSGSGRPDRVTTVSTDSDGVFISRLAPGPDRRVSAAFAGTPTLTHASDDPVRLGVRTGIRLRASAAVATIGGPPVVFNGRVEADAGEMPVDGKAVELQFRLQGLPWSEFRTIQTDANGRFRYPYRFSDDDSHGVRFEFRAFAPAQAGWPYEPAASRPIAVRGR
jgi:hypothetical protein